MARGTTASGNYGTQRTSNGSTSQTDNTLSTLDADGLLLLHGMQIARDLRRKVEKRLRRMKVAIPNVKDPYSG